MTPNVFLLLGKSQNQKSEFLETFLRQQSIAAEDVSRFAAKTADISQIVQDLETPSLFAAKRAFYFDDIDLWSAGALKSITQGAKACSDSIFFASLKTSFSNKALDELNPTTKVFWPRSSADLTSTIERRAQELSIPIEQEAVRLLVDLCDGDEESSLSALPLLQQLPTTPGQKIGPKAILELLWDSRKETVFTIFEALCSDSGESLRGKLDRFTQSLANAGESLAVFKGLTWQLRTALKLSYAIKEGTQESFYRASGLSSKYRRAPYLALCQSASADAIAQILRVTYKFSEKARVTQQPYMTQVLWPLYFHKILQIKNS